MFKKMIVMVMVVIVALSTVACMSVDAVESTPETVPGIVGYEHIDRFIDAANRDANGEEVYDYTIEMIRCDDGFWYVSLTGETDAYWDQVAIGLYDHAPTEEEIDYLWSVRVNEDMLYDKLEELTQ